MSAPRPWTTVATRPGRTRRERGIGLIEILVTVVLLSIGFLAAARMQVEGMRFSQSAYFQSQAYLLAADMIDRMRANSDAVVDGHYDDMVTADGLEDPGCGTSSCNDTSLAAQDRHDWSELLYGDVPALPSTAKTSARGEISALGNGLYRIRMSWGELSGSDDVAETLDVNFRVQR